jgi:hypothetical protein
MKTKLKFNPFKKLDSAHVTLFTIDGVIISTIISSMLIYYKLDLPIGESLFTGFIGSITLLSFIYLAVIKYSEREN